jgi:hypothetical protein
MQVFAVYFAQQVQKRFLNGINTIVFLLHVKGFFEPTKKIRTQVRRNLGVLVLLAEVEDRTPIPIIRDMWIHRLTNPPTLPFFLSFLQVY